MPVCYMMVTFFLELNSKGFIMWIFYTKCNIMDSVFQQHYKDSVFLFTFVSLFIHCVLFSERADPSYCKDRITEGANINKSLVTLGIVISTLGILTVAWIIRVGGETLKNNSYVFILSKWSRYLKGSL